MKRIFISFLFIFLINNVFNQRIIVLPFTKRLDKSKLNNNNIFQYLSNNILSVDFELGNPSQKISLVLSSINYYTYIANEESTSLPFISTFKSNSSNTFYCGTEFFQGSNNDFKGGNGAHDVASYGESTSISQRISNRTFIFILAKEIEDNTTLSYGSGKLGLDVKSDIDDSSYETLNFFESLKTSDIIDFSYFVFNFTSEDNGKLIIGGLPYEYDSSHYQRINFIESKVLKQKFGIYKEEYWSFAINQIFYGKTKPKGRDFVIKTATLKFEEGMLEGPKSIRDIIYEDFFEKYIKEGKCKERLTHNEYFYDCQKEGVDYNKMKSIFLTNDLTNNVFEIKTKEYFYEFNSRKYFLLRFRNNSDEPNDNWILGEPFIKNNLIVFDFDNRQLIFKKTGIPKPEDDIIDIDKKSKTHTGAIVATLFIIIIIGIIVVYILYKKKGKQRSQMGIIDYYYMGK
ncbi:MAG: pepsin-like aspartyl protease [archaeon]|nr:pepsin-like aspartyl protease [archaeon]